MDTQAIEFTVEQFVKQGRERREAMEREAEEYKRRERKEARAQYEDACKQVREAVGVHWPFLAPLLKLPEFDGGYFQTSWTSFAASPSNPLYFLQVDVDRHGMGYRVNDDPRFSPLRVLEPFNDWRTIDLDDKEVDGMYYRQTYAALSNGARLTFRAKDLDLALESASRQIESYQKLSEEAERATTAARLIAEAELLTRLVRIAAEREAKVTMADEGQTDELKVAHLAPGERVATVREVRLLDALSALYIESPDHTNDRAADYIDDIDDLPF